MGALLLQGFFITTIIWLYGKAPKQREGVGGSTVVILHILMPVWIANNPGIRAAKRSAHLVPVVAFSTSASSLDPLFFATHGVALLTRPGDFTHTVAAASRRLAHCRK